MTADRRLKIGGEENPLPFWLTAAFHSTDIHREERNLEGAKIAHLCCLFSRERRGSRLLYDRSIWSALNSLRVNTDRTDNTVTLQILAGLTCSAHTGLGIKHREGPMEKMRGDIRLLWCEQPLSCKAESCLSPLFFIFSSDSPFSHYKVQSPRKINQLHTVQRERERHNWLII